MVGCAVTGFLDLIEPCAEFLSKPSRKEEIEEFKKAYDAILVLNGMSTMLILHEEWQRALWQQEDGDSLVKHLREGLWAEGDKSQGSKIQLEVIDSSILFYIQK